MEINLAGKVAIVTGAARGIGKEIVRGFLKEGMSVAALDLNFEQLQETVTELQHLPGALRAFECDIRDENQLAAAAAAVNAEFGRIDVLVNNAGVVGNGELADLSPSTWDLVHDVNLKGTWLACRSVLPYMKEQRSGRIINAASFAAISPIFGSGAYASSKAAVAHFSRALAAEVGPYDITVNAYAPGMIPTDMNGFADLPQAEQDRLLDTLALRHWGSTDDIVNLLCFLASDKAGYITGTLIDVSGGKLISQIPKLAYDAAASKA